MKTDQFYSDEKLERKKKEIIKSEKQKTRKIEKRTMRQEQKPGLASH